MCESLERKLDQLMREPGNFHLLNQIGRLLYELEDWENGALYFEKAYRLNPSDLGILSNYGALLCQQGETEKAISLYEIFLEQVKDKDVLEKLADCYYQLGQYEAAEKTYAELQEL